MARVNALTHLFNTGRISKAGLNRVDKEAIRLFAERQENLLPYSIGKAIMRPGTKHLGSTQGGRARFIPFAKSPNARAMLELTSGALRVWNGDSLVSRPAVTAAVTSPELDSATGWTTVSTGSVTVSYNSYGLYMKANGHGASAMVYQAVTVNQVGTQHALNIAIYGGACEFSVGSTLNDDDLVPTTSLEWGHHSLAFTPNGSQFFIKFKNEKVTPTVVEACYVDDAGPMVVPAEFSASDLRGVRWTQSLDVLFVAHSNYPVKIERRGDDSWSVVRYLPVNGPFALAPDRRVKMSLSATEADILITASGNYFTNDHIGQIFQITHENTAQTTYLSGADEFTPTVRVVGITESSYSDRDFNVVISGAWSGVLRVQRSFDSPDYGFENFGSAITVNGTVSIDDQQDNAIVYYRVYMQTYTSGNAVVTINYDQAGGTGTFRVTSIVSETQAYGQALTPFTDTAATYDWLPGAWSEGVGWPSAVTLFDGRLFWSADDRFWGTVSDDYYNFSLDEGGDSNSIQRDVAAGEEFSQVNWLLPIQRLIFGTSGAEVSARTSSFDEPLTATNVTLKPASTFGSAPYAPVRMHSRGVFIDLAARKIVELAYSLDAQDYVGSDLTRFNEDLYESDVSIGFDGFVELGVQRAPEPYIWALRNDGIACLMLYNPAEEIRCWSTVSMDGNDDITSVAVVRGSTEDDVYLQVERVINGVTQFHVERLSWHADTIEKLNSGGEIKVRGGLHMLDGYALFAGSGAASQVVTGLTWLIGREVMVIGQEVGGEYGVKPEMLTVNGSGQITLPRLMTGTCSVGLPYAGFYQSAKLAYGAQKGTALLMKKQVEGLGIALLDTHPDALLIGGLFDPDNVDAMDELPRYTTTLVERVVGASGEFGRSQEESMFPFPGEWDTDSRVCIYVRPGHPATLSALVTGITTAES